MMRSRQLATGGLILGASLLIGWAAASLPLWVMAAILFGIGGAFLFLVHPGYVPAAIAFFLPFERIGAMEWHGNTIRMSQIFGLIMMIGFSIFVLRHPRLKFKKNPFIFPGIIFLWINGLSLLHAENVERGLTVFGFIVFTMTLGFFIPQVVARYDQFRVVLKWLLIGTSIVTLFGLFQFIGDMIGLPNAITGLREHYTKIVLGFPRIQSTSLEPLYFANYLLIPLGLLISFFWSKTRPLRGVFVGLLLLLVGINFLLTISRGGYIAALGVLFIVSLFYIREWFDLRKFFFGLFLLVITGGLTLRFLGSSDMWETFVKHSQSIFFGASYIERIENYEKAWNAFLDHPLIGIGVGGFGPLVSNHPMEMPVSGWKIVNNEFLEILAETGVLGFVFFLLMIGMMIIRSLTAIAKTRDPFIRPILIGLFGSFIGILIQYQTFSQLYILHIWFLFGLLIAAQNLAFEKT